jgi:ornithine cyclodeaminase
MTMQPLWITEATVVELMDLSQAIEALEAGLKLESQGAASNMEKTHVSWGRGDTLHAIGATFAGVGYAGSKSWAHTEGGATPLLTIWSAATGELVAIIEAFALGQLRTGAISGVATRWMALPAADTLALIGTGKQALAQLAAVAAVRPLRSVRVFGRDVGRRDKFVETARSEHFGFAITAAATVGEATAGASIVTLATRAREPFFSSTMAERGAHINAIGAITPEREEFAADLLPRAGVVCADDPRAARRLSKEFAAFYGSDESAWENVKPLSYLIAGARGRPLDCDLSVFKAMGMGISDMALGVEIYRRAVEQGLGRPIEAPRRHAPRLHLSRKAELSS